MRPTSSLLARRLFRAPLDCDHLDHLRKLQAEHPESPLAVFSSWNDARRWLNATGAWREAADALLRPVLTAFKRAPNEGWLDVLLFLFWPHLDRITRQLARLEKDDSDDLESRIHWAFLHVLHRIDLDRRETRLGQKLLNDIRHEVRQAYDRDRVLAKRMDPLPEAAEPDDLEEAGTADLEFYDAGFAQCDAEHDATWVVARLESLVRRGRLSQPDYQILIGCHLYGHSLHEMAAQLGLSYEAAKKRQQRSTKILRAIGKEMSPRRGPGGL